MRLLTIIKDLSMAIRKISDERWDKLVTKRASEGYIIHNLPVTSSRQILKITHTRVLCLKSLLLPNT